MEKFVLAEVTQPYSFIESLLYDRIIAPAVAVMMESMAREWADALSDASTVLDVGCGGGQILSYLAEQYSTPTFQGIDLSADQVKRANRRLQKFASRVRVQQGSALALPFADASFDVVYSIASIKHWSDRQQGLNECIRVLKPGGKLLIVEVDRACTLADTEKFISGWKIPRWMQPGGVALFRTWVAGHSPDLLEAQALSSQCSLSASTVERIPDTPALILQGTR